MSKYICDQFYNALVVGGKSGREAERERAKYNENETRELGRMVDDRENRGS